MELAATIDAWQGKNILVLGDMVADIYIDGRISRISREAPVLVLEQEGEKIIAGGAANVVNNIATLGGHAIACGVTGTDSASLGLRAALEANGAEVSGLLADTARPTISKTRIVAGGRATVSQQIVRLDKEWHEEIPRELEAGLTRYIRGVLPEIDGVVISDYGSGTVTIGLKKMLIDYCREHDIPSMVDSRYNIASFKRIGYVKQNDSELAAAVGRRLDSESMLHEAGTELLNKLAADGVLVTRGEQGMTLFTADGEITDIPVTDKSEVFDVSGAGDTCVSAVILALASGAAPLNAARISNYASGIAVRKLGTATVSATELRKVLS